MTQPTIAVKSVQLTFQPSFRWKASVTFHEIGSLAGCLQSTPADEMGMFPMNICNINQQSRH